MATWKDVERIATSLPEVVETSGYDGWRSWKVRGKNVVWERPLGAKDRRDVEALGREVPEGTIIGIRTPDLDTKDALIGENPGVVFTIPHFDRYAAVLVRLDEIDVADLEEYVVEAWLFQAPKRVVTAWQASR
jgi:hypothetical protein